MFLFLVCVTFSGISNTVPAIYPEPNPHYSYNKCTVHDTLKDAAMAEFERNHIQTISYSSPYNKETESVTYYKIDVKEKTMIVVQAPKIRIEVDEK